MGGERQSRQSNQGGAGGRDSAVTYLPPAGRHTLNTLKDAESNKSLNGSQADMERGSMNQSKTNLRQVERQQSGQFQRQFALRFLHRHVFFSYTFYLSLACLTEALVDTIQHRFYLHQASRSYIKQVTLNIITCLHSLIIKLMKVYYMSCDNC